jgi:CheY-like chemotaxis protein
LKETILDILEAVKPKILIVDDKSANLVALETLLRDLPVEIIKAGSGNEALALSLEHEFALVLIDVQMPDMDGFETVELMRQEEATRSVPVIFISAVYSGDYYKIRGVESGAVDFLEKPIVPELLLGKVRIYLDMYQYKVALSRLNAELETKVKKRTAMLAESNALLTREVERRKQVEEQITKTLASLESAQKLAQLGFYERNLQTGEGLWSTGTYHLFGASPDEVQCSRDAFLQRVHDGDRASVEAAFRESEAGHRAMDIECGFTGDDGTERFLRVVGTVECDDQGEPLIHHGMLQDITALKQAET